MSAVDLPYFDLLLPALERGDADLRTAFGRHVHWGYWPDPRGAVGSVADFASAAERMCERVCDHAVIQDGHRILDVGCGLGGTLASLNERYDEVRLTGLNIDERQIAYARKHVTPRPANEVGFVEGDACSMPFEDHSFDRVLAVECAFHFPSRARFFAEAARVLRPGGRLALCDFMPIEPALPFLFAQRLLFDRYVRRLVGPTDISHSRNMYVELAREHGFELEGEDDVTPNVLPTYRVLRHVARRVGRYVATAHWGTSGLEMLGKLGLLRYVILGFRRRG